MACVTYLDYMARAKSAMIWLPFVVIWTILALHAAAYFQCEVPGNRLCRLDVLEEGNWVHEPRGKMMRWIFAYLVWISVAWMLIIMRFAT